MTRRKATGNEYSLFCCCANNEKMGILSMEFPCGLQISFFSLSTFCTKPCVYIFTLRLKLSIRLNHYAICTYMYMCAALICVFCLNVSSLVQPQSIYLYIIEAVVAGARMGAITNAHNNRRCTSNATGFVDSTVPMCQLGNKDEQIIEQIT